MSFTGKVGRNTIIQVAGKILGTLLGIVVIALLQRYLGPFGFGQYTTIIAYLGFASVIADLGLYLIVVREISKKDADPNRVIGNVFSIRIMFAILILGIAAGIAFAVPYAWVVKIGILIGTLSFIFVAMNQLLVGIFQKHLVMNKVVIGEIVGRIVLLGLVYLFIKMNLSLPFIIAAVVAGSFANFLVVYLFARKYVTIRFRFEFDYWLYIFKETWPIAVSVILNLIYFKIDTLLLSLFKSSFDVGLYGASYKILEIMVTFPNMFVGLILPALAYYAFLERERFIRIFKKAFDVIIIFILPIVTGGIFVARPLLVLIGGEEYAAAAPIFRILLFAIGFLFLGSLSGHTIVAIKKQRKMVRAYLGVALTGLVVYLILIPSFSYYGAAAGTVLTEFLIALIGYIIILRTIKFSLSAAVFFKSLAASLVMAVGLYLLRDQNIFVQLISATVIYGVFIILFKGITKDVILEILKIREKEGASYQQ